MDDAEKRCLSYDALYESMRKCKRGVMWKSSVARFVLNGVEETLILQESLENGTYKPRKPHRFRIMKPKPRNLCSISFRDRVYQRSLNDNELYPKMSKAWIRENCACQKNKGTDFARNLLKRELRRHYMQHGTEGWYLQADVHGYYEHMRHDIAKANIGRYCDPGISARAGTVLDDQYAVHGEAGFDPGSQMVQITGVSYLSRMDHVIKERLRMKNYVRYMDDFVIISDSREKLEECLERIREELEAVALTFNPKKTGIKPLKDGIMFLGFRFSLSDTGKVYMRIDPRNPKEERRRLAKYARLVKRGEMTQEKMRQCYECWKNHASKGNSYHLLKRMDKYFATLTTQIKEAKHEDRTESNYVTG